MAKEPEALVRSLAARQPVLDDPRLGYVEGARRLRALVNGTVEWLGERDAVVENVALRLTPTRTVEEVDVHLCSQRDGVRVELPVAIVSERNPPSARSRRSASTTACGRSRVSTACVLLYSPQILRYNWLASSATTRRRWPRVTWRVS